MTKKALIIGITGQDGVYLAELLIEKGYEVHGIKRRASSFNTDRIDHLYQDLHEKDLRLRLYCGDLTDATNLIRIVQPVQPDEIYNLTAQSHVAVSFETPEYTANLDALVRCGCWGQREFSDSRRRPVSNRLPARRCTARSSKRHRPKKRRSIAVPHAAHAYWITVNYRDAYGMYACNGILFNHEGPTRGETFVTRKITRGLACIREGLEDSLYLGNRDALRDWGHARYYVKAQWLMLQQEQAEDFVIATGKQYSVREFVGTPALLWRSR